MVQKLLGEGLFTNTSTELPRAQEKAAFLGMNQGAGGALQEHVKHTSECNCGGGAAPCC